MHDLRQYNEHYLRQYNEHDLRQYNEHDLRQYNEHDLRQYNEHDLHMVKTKVIKRYLIQQLKVRKYDVYLISEGGTRALYRFRVHLYTDYIFSI